MNSLQPYILPLKGLGDGKHQFDFVVDADFFLAFEASPVGKADIELSVELVKQPSLLVFNFVFSGWVETACDRCLTTIKLPTKGDNRLLVKYGEDREDVSQDDVAYIPAETSSWSMAQYVYEYILLSLPLIKVYDCKADEQPPCDNVMLEKLEGPEQEATEEQANNPFRDALKGWDNQPDK